MARGIVSGLNINSAKRALQVCFNGVVIGLHSQHYAQCMHKNTFVNNLGGPGVHDAMGWLTPWDRQNPKRRGIQKRGVVASLHEAVLNDEVMAWWHRIGHRQRSSFYRCLRELVYAHDYGHTPEAMQRRLRDVGMEFGLKWPLEEA